MDPVKINGSAKFGIDAKVDGMVYAAITTCPAVGGKVVSVDESAISGKRGIIKVVKLDVDQNPAVTGKYGIRAMPTLILFKNGQVTAQHTGALVQKKKLEDWINTSVA